MRSTYKLLCMLGSKEACVLVPYSDQGEPAIGFGHRDPSLKIGDTAARITVEQAFALLAADLRKYEDRVEQAITVPMLPQQNDALVDFDFNTGAIFGGTVDDLFNAGDLVAAMNKLEQYDKAKNKDGVRVKLPGLTARRARERAIFENADYGAIGSFMLYADGYPGKGVPTLFPPDPAGEIPGLPPATVFPVLKPGQYRVQAGDTLYRIARSNGLSVDALKTINGLKTDALMAGATIWLLPPLARPDSPKIPTVILPPTTIVAPLPTGWLIEPGDGWGGTLGYQFNSVDEFEDWLETIKFGKWRPQFVVVHNTGAPNEAQWDATPGGDKQRLRNLTHYYKNQNGWPSGPHAFIRGKRIFAFSPLTAPGTHSPSWNGRAWGVELAADYDRDTLDADERSTVIGALAALHAKLGIDPIDHVLGVRGLHYHRDDPKTTHRHCPGKNLGERAALAEAVRQRMDGVNVNEHS